MTRREAIDAVGGALSDEAAFALVVLTNIKLMLLFQDTLAKLLTLGDEDYVQRLKELISEDVAGIASCNGILTGITSCRFPVLSDDVEFQVRYMTILDGMKADMKSESLGALDALANLLEPMKEWQRQFDAYKEEETAKRGLQA